MSKGEGIEIIFWGKEMIYPDCQYASKTNILDSGEPHCDYHGPHGLWWCGTHHNPRNKGTNNWCPYDLVQIRHNANFIDGN